MKSGKKVALITGIFGQDGAYLAELLLSKGYHVVGGHRRAATRTDWRLVELGIADDVEYVDLELLEFSNILSVVDKTEPDEVFNLAAQSFVGASFEQPLYTSDVDGLGVLRMLEAIRTVNSDIRIYQASTSEMFGKVQEIPQRESTAFHPRSPYGVAKLYGHWIIRNYRESYGLHATSGILFNHESPLRGIEFVTRKITSSLALIKAGKQKILELGNMEAKRDWGHAKDYVRGMHAMVQADDADDFVLATGETRSVEEFVEIAGEAAGFSLEWSGEGEERIATDRKTGDTIVQVNPVFFRPAEVDLLVGDAEKASSRLGWKREYSFADLVTEMVEADLRRARDNKILF